jgi:hypothetical protein
VSQSAAIEQVPSGPARLRQLPSIDSEPPFDDELAESPSNASRWRDGSDALGTGGQSVLPLTFALPNGLPNVPAIDTTALGPEIDRTIDGDSTGSPRLRLIAASQPIGRPRKHRRTSAATLDEEFGPQLTPRAQLPEPQLWAARLVQAFIEVQAGRRPATQLIRWTTTAVQEAIVHRSTAPGAAERLAAGPGRQLGEVVRSVRASEPIDGVVEVSAVVQRGERCRAVALRLEGIDGRWQCTALELG